MATVVCRVVFVSVPGTAPFAPIAAVPRLVLAATARAVRAVAHTCAYAGRLARPAPRVWAEAPVWEAPVVSVHVSPYTEPLGVAGRRPRRAVSRKRRA